MKASIIVLIFLLGTGLLIVPFGAIPVVEGGANLEVISHSSYYTDRKFRYTIIGEVQNLGDQTARIDNITATMYNAENEVVATLTARETSYLHCLMPGRKSPFLISILHYDLPAENYQAFHSYSINVEYTPIPHPLVGLKILGYEAELSYTSRGALWGIIINGTIQYTGNEPVHNIKVFVTIYDAEGQPIGLRTADAFWEDPTFGVGGSFEPNQIGKSMVGFENQKLSKAFGLEEFWLIDAIASYELTGEIPERVIYAKDGSVEKVIPYYALDTGQAPPTTPDPSPSPEPTPPPPLPDNAIKVDRSNITPVNQIEEVPVDQVHVFEYKNLFLAVETTGAPATLNLTASETNSQTVKIYMELEEATRLDVRIANEVTKLEKATDQEEAMMKQALKSIDFYMDLEQHSSPKLKANFALFIDEVKLEEELGREVDVSSLSWLYWNTANQHWVKVPSYLDADGFLVCETTHFSTWTVAEVESEGYSVLGIPLAYLVAIAVIAIGVAVVTLIFRKRK